MYLSAVLERVKDFLGDVDSSCQPSWSDARLVRDIDGALERLWNKARDADENWGLERLALSSIGSIANTFGDAVEIHLNRPLGKVVYIRDDYDPAQELHHDFLVSENDWLSPTEPNEGRGCRWHYGANNTILWVQLSDPAIDPANITIWHVKMPPKMARFASSVHPTTTQIDVNVASGVSLGKLPAVSGEMLNGIIYCTTAPSQLNPQGRYAYITGYDAQTLPTMRITARPSDLALANGTSYTWEIVAPWPPEHMDLVAAIAASKALVRYPDAAQIQAVAVEIGRLMKEFTDAIEERQLKTPRYVRFYDDSRGLY